MSYIGNLPKTATFAIDTFNGDGGTLNFTLREAPVSVSSILVFVGGVRQATDTYTLSGATLSFTEAPPTGTNNIQVLFLGLGASPLVPSDLSVSTIKIQDGAITAAKLAANSVTTNTLANDAVQANNILNDAVTADKLADTTVSAGNYGSDSQIPTFTVDAQGRLTYAANVSINIPAGYNTANAIPTMLMLSGM